MYSSTSSAPGKAILFGEHAVVHGTTAVAAALSDLRIFARVVAVTGNPKITITFEDIDLDGINTQVISFEMLQRIFSYNKDPFKVVYPSEIEKVNLSTELSNHTATVKQALATVIFIVSNILSDFVWKKGRIDESYEIKVNIKSQGLPIGAGLGSSAAFSVALVGACIEIAHALLGKFELQTKEEITWTTPDQESLTIINNWAFAAEILNHGSPSGLDNSTCCFGGLIRYRRTEDGKSTYDQLSQKPLMNILLTNTKVPRSTRDLVQKVADLLAERPDIVKPLFTAIEKISMRFIQILESRSYIEDSKKLLPEIDNLFSVNQALLASLGVSHSSLELVHKESAAVGFGCKLTGAGGGGCAMTLLPWTEEPSIGSVNVAKLNDLIERLKSHGFETFQTSIAGDGVRWHRNSNDSL